jgi:hypothetical protein
MVNSEELVGTTEYLTLYRRCLITNVVITGFYYICRRKVICVHAINAYVAVAVSLVAYLPSALNGDEWAVL